MVGHTHPIYGGAFPFTNLMICRCAKRGAALHAALPHIAAGTPSTPRSTMLPLILLFILCFLVFVFHLLIFIVCLAFFDFHFLFCCFSFFIVVFLFRFWCASHFVFRSSSFFDFVFDVCVCGVFCCFFVFHFLILSFVFSCFNVFSKSAF